MRLQPDGPQTDRPDALPRDVNMRVMLLTGVSLAIVAAYASFYPSEVALAMFSMVATWAALGTAFVALIVSHRVFAPHLNLWDKALMIALAALVSGALVDGDAVTAFIETSIAAGAGAGAAPPASATGP